MARPVAPGVTGARLVIGDAFRCLPGGTEDNHEKRLIWRSKPSEALWRKASCSQF